MKTFAVDSTVIFVTEVIFLGIYCTFFVMRHTQKSAPLNAFFKKKKQEKMIRSNYCQLEKQSVNFFETKCHLIASLDSLFNLHEYTSLFVVVF